jgi:S-adenosylhomocysteine hydrolase
MMYERKIQNALDNFPTKIPNDFPTSLPLLDDFRQNHRKKRAPLANLEVLMIQHTLGPFLLRLEALFEEGLKPERTWLVDIPYSTNEKVRKEIPQRFGIPELQISPPFRDPIAPYSTLQLHRVEDAIYHLANRVPRSPLLVIDDGAYFVRAIKNLEDLEPGFASVFKGKTSIVEQTTRGHRYLEHKDYIRQVQETLESPVVSIARCKTKAGFEAPFIGAAASRALVGAFEREGIHIENFNRIAIIGFGLVGQAVFHALKDLGNDKLIYVVDPDLNKQKRISELGGEPLTGLPDRGNFDLVVGCTGYASFSLKDWDCLSNDAYLVSTSSAAVEFNRKQFVDLAELYPDDEIEIVNKEETRKSGIHATLKIRDGERNRQVTFIHASFPVNFDGRMECLPVEVIQATHTLLHAAGQQALETKRPGMKWLDPGIDAEIMEKAFEYI